MQDPGKYFRNNVSNGQNLLDAMLARSDVMVQQLVPEIRTRGELSLMFFGALIRTRVPFMMDHYEGLRDRAALRVLHPDSHFGSHWS